MVLRCLAGNQCRVVVLLRRIQMARVAPEYGYVPPTVGGRCTRRRSQYDGQLLEAANNKSSPTRNGGRVRQWDSPRPMLWLASGRTLIHFYSLTTSPLLNVTKLDLTLFSSSQDL
jgi:hypothetical protein